MPTKLGQNFLTNESIACNIVKSANIEGGNILEIGPGKGVLTKYLAEQAGRLLAVEIDRELANKLNIVIASKAKQSQRGQKDTGLLRRSAPRNYKVTIINGDILKINLPKLIEENDFQNYKVVANLPYYITSKIIRLLLETKYPPAEMILMVQKEVGERIVAADGKESLLSTSVKFYAEPKILFPVSKDNFSPVPDVDSAVVRIKRKKTVPQVDVKKFFSLVRAGFSAKRKMLANNLASSFKVSKDVISEKIKKAGLEPTTRAERLSVEDWVKLYNLLKK